MSTTTTTNFASVVAALRDVHDEASLWHLSDELAAAIPQGDVSPVVKAAEQAGVPVRSANTLRLYRDVAVRFPKGQRVSGVSFSAHREALTVGSATDAETLLHDLVSKMGSAGITVTTVRRAVQAQTGKGAASTAGVGKAGAAVKLTWAQIMADLCAGGPDLIAQIDVVTSATSGVSLDTLHAGLNKVLTEVENRRVKAARAAAKKKAPVQAAAKAPAPAAPRKAAAKGGAGDLRDL
jgi:hypothetical protein